MVVSVIVKANITDLGYQLFFYLHFKKMANLK